MEQSKIQRLNRAQRLEGVIKMSQRGSTGQTVKEISEETGITEKHLYTLERKYQEVPSMVDRER